MEISEGVICQGRNSPLDFHNSPDDTQPLSVIVDWEDIGDGPEVGSIPTIFV